MLDILSCPSQSSVSSVTRDVAVKVPLLDLDFLLSPIATLKLGEVSVFNRLLMKRLLQTVALIWHAVLHAVLLPLSLVLVLALKGFFSTY